MDRVKSFLARVPGALQRRFRLLRVAFAAMVIRVTDRKPAPPPPVAAGNGRHVISPEYMELNRQMHREREGYGVQAQYHLTPIRIIVRALSGDVLDYGCGKQLLQKGLGFPIQNYDPGIPGLDESPRPADVVACLDVLEHIEPDHLDAVLDDLQRVTLRGGYLCVSTESASKQLPDGRNAHLIVEDGDWWQERLERRFRIRLRLDEPGHAIFVVQASEDSRAREPERVPA